MIDNVADSVVAEGTGHIESTDSRRCLGGVARRGRGVDSLLTFKDGHQEVWESKGFAADVW